MKIRKAETKDINAILNLLKQVNLIHHNGRPDIFNIGTKYTYEQLVEIIDDDNCSILVANDNGKIKGYAFCIYQENKNDNILTDIKTLYLDDLCVDKNYRGKHIGKKLYDAVLELAKEKHCYNILYNSLPLGLLQESAKVLNLGIQDLRLNFTTESPAQAGR